VVSHTVLLDAGPLGLVTNPRRARQSVACAQWLQALVRHGSRVLVPEIADYEVRRELLRANKVRGLARLDALAGLLEYLPLTTAAMRQAAIFWAQARQQGRPTADDKALDGDVILAAQAMTLGATDVVIATTNVGHLSRFAPAALWPDITAAS
jgi:predicted nucleic acid-binding protein